MRNRNLRIEVAVNLWKKDESWCNDVIFLDESKFNLFESDGRVLVGRKPNTELRPQNLKPTVKHGGGHVMVWGCISSKSVGNLVFIDGIMNQHSYLKILKDNLKQSADKMGIKDTCNYILSTKLTKYGHGCFIIVQYIYSTVIEPPSQSTDMNQIEML